eukprot:PITA_29054
MAAAAINGNDCKPTIVCVTGATGFLASWLVKRLLEKGYTVHATVRDPENNAKVRHLLDIPEGGERLKLFRADLLEEGSFDAAIHMAVMVFFMWQVLSTSPLKILRHIRLPRRFQNKQRCNYGKEDPGLDVVTIIPVLVGGPAITPNVPYSVRLTLSLLTGDQQHIQALKHIEMAYGSIRLVHVEDVSSAHIFLMETPSAHGRYICCPIITTVPQLTEYLSKRYPQYNVTIQ